METFWYVVVTLMLAGYVVLDGFDFGVGIIYLWAGRTEIERRTALAAIGPVWNGNEVWLVAAGGLLFFAFPRAYAAGFSGFYLALTLVLWLLIFRGLSLELRSHLDHPLWRRFWDAAFAASSLLLAVVFGAALGNLIRGVPVGAEGYFFTPLWTGFSPTDEPPGILDWYTVLMGIVSAAILALHGASYLALKTEEEIHGRAARAAGRLGWIVVLLTGAALIALPFVRPALRHNFADHPAGYLLPVTGLAALGALLWLGRRGRDLAAFLASSLFIAAMLGSAAWGVYPNLLMSTIHPEHSLTAFNAAAGAYGLRVGLVWFSIGFPLALAYTLYVHGAFRGKVRLDQESAPAE